MVENMVRPSAPHGAGGFLFNIRYFLIIIIKNVLIYESQNKTK
jgi:hypothetical protein